MLIYMDIRRSRQYAAIYFSFQPHNKIFFSLLKKFVQCAIIVISVNRLHTQKGKRLYKK